jgi:hypothetical protein
VGLSTGRRRGTLPRARGRRHDNLFTQETDMPTVLNPTLTLTTVNSDTTIDVTYDVEFSEFERNLAADGMRFHHHIDVIGVDPAGSTTGTTLVSFPTSNIPVTQGAGSLVVARNASLTVLRSLLQEDAAAGDSDEIRCKIRIHSVGLPPDFTPDVFTVQRVLVG